MMIPTVHRNGTSKDALLEGTLATARAVRDAIESLQANAPNARDYYVQGDGAFRQATQEHGARLQRLSDVLNELSTIAEGIADQE
jgi:hypothetical protein